MAGESDSAFPAPAQESVTICHSLIEREADLSSTDLFGRLSARSRTSCQEGMRARDPRLKRCVDFVLSGLMLLATAPVLIVAVVAIKLEDRGPVFYRQKRWGLRGKPFDVLKFRTMVWDNGCDQMMARENDERITRVGRLLRSTGLDELPQFLNIMRGEMSIVGPRPLAVDERLLSGDWACYEELPGFEKRLRVRPGLTSLATVYVPKDASPRRKFRYDTLYVSRQSFLLDLKLIVLSYWISLTCGWERRERKMRKPS